MYPSTSGKANDAVPGGVEKYALAYLPDDSAKRSYARRKPIRNREIEQKTE
jgi:hypothetical protein